MLTSDVCNEIINGKEDEQILDLNFWVFVNSTVKSPFLNGHAIFSSISQDLWDGFGTIEYATRFKKMQKSVFYRIFDIVSEIHSWIYVFVEVLVVSMISASASTLTFWQSSLFSKFEGSILVLEETETGFPFMLTEFFCNALKAISALAMALRVCVCCICNCNCKKKIVK